MKMNAMLVIALVAAASAGCDYAPTTDEKQAAQQAQALEQAHAQVGMPAISNFSEKRMMKDIYELRDKPFATHTYLVNEQTGCLMYLGPSVGFGLPYATQFTSPTKWEYSANHGYRQSPQAEPNGLFMPSHAEGTWVMLKDPGSDDVKVVYIEPRVVVSPFRLPSAECTERPAAQMQPPKAK